MSRATELATECGAILDEESEIFVMDEQELEAFYHAARAEALREAGIVCAEYAARLLGMSHHDHPSATAAACDLAEELRAMSDREGK